MYTFYRKYTYFPVILFTYNALWQVGSNITLDPHSPQKPNRPTDHTSLCRSSKLRTAMQSSLCIISTLLIIGDNYLYVIAAKQLQTKEQGLSEPFFQRQQLQVKILYGRGALCWIWLNLERCAFSLGEGLAFLEYKTWMNLGLQTFQLNLRLRWITSKLKQSYVCFWNRVSKVEYM